MVPYACLSVVLIRSLFIGTNTVRQQKGYSKGLLLQYLIVLDVDELVDRHGDNFHCFLHHLLRHIRALPIATTTAAVRSAKRTDDEDENRKRVNPLLLLLLLLSVIVIVYPCRASPLFTGSNPRRRLLLLLYYHHAHIKSPRA